MGVKENYASKDMVILFVCLFGWFGFMAYQPLKVIYRQIQFYRNKQFYFKQSSLA